jgi:hypothetical protein
MICSDTVLWRAVLVQALRDPDAPAWIHTQDAETVCSLAGLDHSGVMRAYRAGLPPQTRTGRKRAA